MGKQKPAGEILKGHYGQYRVFQYSEIGLPEKLSERFLQGTSPGNCSWANQTWRCLENDGLFIAASCCDRQKKRSVDTCYYHARYFSASVEALRSAMDDSIFSRFATEDEFEQIASGEIPLAPGWLGSHLSNAKDSCRSVSLDPARLADLACACLYRGAVQDYSGLVILVPAPFQYNGLGYCRRIIKKISDCIPFGLRRYLSFATNPDDLGRKAFTVSFADKEDQAASGRMCVSLYKNGPWPDSLNYALDPEIVELIGAVAQNRSILEKIYSIVEEGAELEQLTLERYASYWRTQKWDYLPLNWELLREYQKSLEHNELNAEDQEYISAHIAGRLDGSLDEVLLGDPDLRDISTLEQLLLWLQEYRQVFETLGMSLGYGLSTQVLEQCLPISLPLEELLAYNRSLEDKWGEFCARMNEEVLQRHKEQVQKLIEQENNIRTRAFLDELPQHLDNWREGGLSTAKKLLSHCDKTIIDRCMHSLAQSALDRLNKDSGIPEADVCGFYQAVTGVLEIEQQKDLIDWMSQWEQAQKERKELLKKLTSFEAYLSVESPDEGCARALWDHFTERGRRQAGMNDLLLAAERVEQKAWPLLSARLGQILTQFVKTYRMGVWVDAQTRIVSLYSDLLHYQMLVDDSVKTVYLWYEDEQEPQELTLDEMLRTIEIVIYARQEKTWEISRKCSDKALECLIKFGMVRQEDHSLLVPFLNNRAQPLFPEESSGGKIQKIILVLKRFLRRR